MNTNQLTTAKDIRLELGGFPSGNHYSVTIPPDMLRKFANAPWLRPEMKTPDHVAPEDKTHYRAAVAVGFRLADFEQELGDLDALCRAHTGQPFSFDVAFPKGQLSHFQEVAATVPALNERSRHLLTAAFADGFESAYTGASLTPRDFAEEFASVITLGADNFALVTEEESRGARSRWSPDNFGLDPIAPGIAPGTLAETYHLGHRCLALGGCLAQFLQLRSRGHSLQELATAATTALIKQMEERPIQPIEESVMRRLLAQ